MKALANRWYVYWVEGDDFEDEAMTPENTPWDELTLFIDPKNNEINSGDRIIMIRAATGDTGWMKVPDMTFHSDYNKPLPPESHKYWIQAVFEEV